MTNDNDKSYIVEVVRQYVPDLRRMGRTWKACCPFHEERTPSFIVDPERGTWHCFGKCSTGGDARGFAQLWEERHNTPVG